MNCMLAPSSEQLHASVLLFVPKADGIKVETCPQGKVFFFSCGIKMSASSICANGISHWLQLLVAFFFLLLWGYQSSLESCCFTQKKIHTACRIHVKLAPNKRAFGQRLARWMNRTPGLKLERCGALCKVNVAKDWMLLQKLLLQYSVRATNRNLCNANWKWSTVQDWD